LTAEVDAVGFRAGRRRVLGRRPRYFEDAGAKVVQAVVDHDPVVGARENQIRVGSGRVAAAAAATVGDDVAIEHNVSTGGCVRRDQRRPVWRRAESYFATVVGIQRRRPGSDRSAGDGCLARGSAAVERLPGLQRETTQPGDRPGGAGTTVRATKGGWSLEHHAAVGLQGNGVAGRDDMPVDARDQWARTGPRPEGGTAAEQR